MVSNSFAVIFMCFVTYAASQTYQKVTLKDCGSKNVKVNRFDIQPMPIIHPGKVTLSVDISATEPIRGVIKADVKLIRTVSGIKLPVSCYIVEGEQVGSCNYPDLCALMQRLTGDLSQDCHPSLVENGIDCTCPVYIPKTALDIIFETEIPKVPEFANWLAVGDMDCNLKATVGNLAACYDIGFAMKPAK
ncbi:unnamed protein product [Adineta steineri]|uniref:MD-2-related lipid-recognition domain-containing protein n=1 Tax=Adineta steineri TaxID=433720 RepID=A0A818NH40_9BILA|nr:unnamed protein product [Adineta steineri]CAF1258734.1 unnamed protein product [Adineta steineri]CAF3603992.1 unnamed protein product [Adineta steineri]CAF3606873.1 unnamed protein product [Adineta steineri]